MQVIPVVDIKGGEAVRAVGGRRDEYRPLSTPLCPTSRPCDVVAAFLGLFPFPIVYVADLDAIEGRESDALLMRNLAASFPETTFWRDAGAGSMRVVAPNVVPVIGSETLPRDRPPENFAQETPSAVLSLDFRATRFLGPPDLLASPRLWPRRVIVMTLAEVGMDRGPDEAALREVKSRCGDREIFAAGGVRGLDDLASLARLGVSGALVASALHNGRLAREDLDRIAALELS
jgi:phosphoribosylformimino-5-aminoimidazole carboxamide ribotide isomerase